MPPTLILIYCSLIFLASMVGGSLPSYLKLTHTRLQLAMSLIGGLMLGVALLHLLPHSAVATESLDSTVMAATGGLLTMFFLIRIFHVHPHSPHDETPVPCHHAIPSVSPDSQLDHPGTEHLSFSPTADGRIPDSLHAGRHDHDHGHAHVGSHEHHHADDHEHEHHASHAQPAGAEDAESRVVTGSRPQHFSWFGLAIGLSIHTMIDGMALAASVAIDADHGTPGLWGLPAFLAIALHKPLDAMSIATVMSAGGWTRRATRAVTVIFSLMCPLGALAFLFGIERLFDQHHYILGIALGFSAGVFLCIALSDLLPEVQFHSHDRIKLSAALLAGVTLAYLITFIEPEHVHGNGVPHDHGLGHEGPSHDADHSHGDSHEPHAPHDHDHP
jgi:zinc and cadmium transporter